MRDLTEKYLAIERDFPNRAGKLFQILETQKRLIDAVMRDKQSEQTKALLLTVAEGYEVGVELLDYMHKIIQGVANDATALKEGSEIRNINQMQGIDIQRSLELADKYTALVVENNALKRKLKAYNGVA